MRTLPLEQDAALRVHQDHPGSRVELVCGACTWSRPYHPERIIEGLVAKRLGGPETAVAAIAGLVQWPCPRCRRMRWGSRLVSPG